MALFSFFKNTQHQRFNYKPRFYDERKEALHERLRQYKDEQAGNFEEEYNPDLLKKRIAGGLRKASIRSKDPGMIRRANQKSNMTVLAVLIVLLGLSFLLLTEFLPQILEATGQPN